MPSAPADTLGDFASLFRYDHWANLRVLDAMRAAEDRPERAVELFSHLLRAQDVWLGRIRSSERANVELWGTDDLETCAERTEASMWHWQTVLQDVTTEDLDRPVAYTNSKGTAFETPLRDVLVHVINHGTHHRAQIALVLRDAGIAPPPTDYIFYLRERDE